MPGLLADVLAYIHRSALLDPGDRVGVAVSGGADSVALLRLLLDARSKLGIVLSVVHFNHKIRADEADRDEAFVADLARSHELEFRRSEADAREHARKNHLSLEAAGRALRYGYFRKLLAEGGLNRIATAHTRDDQAETVLLRLLRGAGTRGLAGIYPKVTVREPKGMETGRNSQPGAHPGTIIRPLLTVERQTLRSYLGAISQQWREDSSNLDLKHSRNRIRHVLLPLLEREYNPALSHVLAKTAEVARAEEGFWARQTARLLPDVLLASPEKERHAARLAGKSICLQIERLLAHPVALQRRLVRATAERAGIALGFDHVDRILGLARSRAGEPARVALPGGLFAVRVQNRIYLEPRLPQTAASGYDYALPVPGEVQIPELRTAIRASLVQGEGYNFEQLLDPASAATGLRVRSWRAGDRYQPAHTKNPRKLKELLQRRHIPQLMKGLWPVVADGSRILWVPGFELPQDVRLRAGGPGILLQVTKEPEPGESMK